jgi:hypothetical protein
MHLQKLKQNPDGLGFAVAGARGIPASVHLGLIRFQMPQGHISDASTPTASKELDKVGHIMQVVGARVLGRLRAGIPSRAKSCTACSRVAISICSPSKKDVSIKNGV